MKRYFKIYKAILKINLNELLAYRANFINSIIGSFAWGFFSVSSILILTSKTTGVFGWTKEEIIMLTGLYQIFIGFYHAIFSGNFERLGRIIFYGQLDPILLKPIDSQFAMSFWIFSYSSLVRVLVGGPLLIYLLLVFGYSVVLSDFILFLGVIFLSYVVLYSIWLLVSTILIWIPEISNIVEVLFNITGITRFPPEMYKRISGTAFIILLPLLLVLSLPLRILIGKINSFEIFLIILFSFILFFSSRLFWKFALRHYGSAGG